MFAHNDRYPTTQMQRKVTKRVAGLLCINSMHICALKILKLGCIHTKRIVEGDVEVCPGPAKRPLVLPTQQPHLFGVTGGCMKPLPHVWNLLGIFALYPNI
jgi:hypothetical protein